MPASAGLLAEKSIVIVDAEKVTDPPRGPSTLYSLPLIETALRLGNVRVANIVSLGVLIGFSSVCSRVSLEQAVRNQAPKGFLELNLEALDQGFR